MTGGNDADGTASDGTTGRIDLVLRSIFASELDRQSSFAIMAFDDLTNLALGEPPPAYRTWSAIQTLLVAAANVSKIFWPIQARLARGAALRALYSVADDSPIADRCLRNHFEHFDERIDDSAPTSADFVDSNIGPLEWFQGMTVLRNYDPARQLVTFRDEEYHLTPIVEELRRIEALARVSKLPR